MKSNPTTPINDRSHCAHYMVLLGPSEAPRALLFNGECHYLAEMFDEDGMLVENLVKSSRMCPPPRGLQFGDVVPAPAMDSGEAARYFELA